MKITKSSFILFGVILLIVTMGQTTTRTYQRLTTTSNPTFASVTVTANTAASPGIKTSNGGLFMTTNYFGFSSSGVTKYFFQNQTDRGLVLAASNPITHVNNADAIAAAPTLRIAPDFSNGAYTVDDNAGARWDVSVRTVNIETVTPSATADSQGRTGDIRWDASYVYIKTGAGWKRAAIATF